MAIQKQARNWGRRGLSLLLTIVMVISLVQVTAFAAGYTDQVGDYQGYADTQPTVTGSISKDADTSKSLEDGNLTMSKTIAQTGENAFDITLLVTTTEQLEEIPLSQDAAVVLLIDASASMWNRPDGTGTVKWTGAGWTTNVPKSEQRLTYAKDAANAFIESFSADANGKRMVAVGSFSIDAALVAGWTDANDDTNGAANRQALATAIDGIAMGSSTNPDAALQLAYNLFGDSAVSTIASRYVILLTDGQPNAQKSNAGSTSGVSGYSSGSGKEAAAAAAATASSLKTDRKVTLYTLAFATAEETCYSESVALICNQSGWHQHTDDEFSASGRKGRLINGQFSEHQTAGSSSHSGDDSCAYGWFNGRHSRMGTATVTVGGWLESIASSGCYKNATTGESVSISFQEISETIRKLLQAWEVTDPLGSYIRLTDASALLKNANVSLTRDRSGSTTGFTWNLWDETPTVGKNAAGETTYTYTLKYNVTLDTSAEGFRETETVNGVQVDKYYPTNGATKLSYITDALNADGTLNTNAELSYAYFNVPTVKGTIPDCGYTIRYWYQDKTTGEYVLGKTTSGTVKLYSQINVSSVDYSKDGYAFARGDNGTQTVTNAKHEFDLYYDPTPVTVTVNHYVVTQSVTDGSVAYSAPALQKTETFPDAGGSGQYYLKDAFTYDESGLLDSAIYTKVSSVTVNGTTYTTDKYQNVTLNAASNTINIYYTAVDGNRTIVPYEINYYYREDAWQFNGLKYELVEGSYVKDPALSQSALEGYKGAAVTAAAQATKGGKTYTLDTAKSTTDLTITLADSGNVIHVYYYYTPAAPNADAATLTITHKYFTESSDGTKTLDGTWVETAAKTVYVGETHWATMTSTYDGNTYTYVPKNSTSYARITEAGKAYQLVVEYTRGASEPATVEVTHTYYKSVWTLVSGGSGAEATYQYVRQTEPEEVYTDNYASVAFYAGDSFTPGQRPNGYELVGAESDTATVTLHTGKNTFNMVYEITVGGPDEEKADVTVNHIYETYKSYVNDEGQVVTNELVSTETESDDTVSGYPGEYFTAKLQEKDGFEMYQADSENLRVILEGVGGQYNIYYRKTVNKLGDAVTVTVQPIYKTYTYVDGATEPVVTTETAAAVTMPGSYYAGQKVTADTRDYNKLEFVTVTDDQGNQTQQRAYTYDPADADGTAGATITVTASGENRITLVYQKVVDTRTPASVVIRNHYYLLTLTSDEFGTVVKTPTQWSNTGAIYSGYFLGDTFTTTGKGSDNGYDVDTRAGIRQPAATVTVDRQVTYVDFYWYKEADRTTPATVRVIHHYEIQDANPNGVSRSWTVGEDDAPLTGYYAGYVYLASPDYQGNAFSEENIVSVSPAGALTTGTALQAGSNEIHIYYVQKVDTRAATSITVIHRYFHDADALSQGSVEAVYEENISAMEADAYTAQLRSENGGVVYGYDSAEPALTIVADANADKNVIVLNYVRAEAVYTVNHTYYLNGRLQGTVSETFGGKAGDVITGASIEKRTGFGGNTYAYTGCAPDSITLRADGENVMTLRYDRTVSGNNGGGSSQTPPATTVDPDVPLEELPDGDVPLGELPDVDEPLEELPDEDVPLGELPDVDEPLEELPDEDTPLASVPRTGDRTLAWTMAAAVSGLGLVFLAVSGRKRREEP